MSFRIKSLVEVYALLVCFITMLALLISSGKTVDHLITYAVPELRRPDVFVRFADNEAYRIEAREGRCSTPMIAEMDGEFCKDLLKRNPEANTASDAEIAKRRAAERIFKLNGLRADALSGFFDQLIAIMVALFGFFAHWRLYRRTSA